MTLCRDCAHSFPAVARKGTRCHKGYETGDRSECAGFVRHGLHRQADGEGPEAPVTPADFPGLDRFNGRQNARRLAALEDWLPPGLARTMRRRYREVLAAEGYAEANARAAAFVSEVLRRAA